MSITTQSNQQPVPASRTWLLKRTTDRGLIADGPALSLQVGEALLYQFDFSSDLPPGARVATIVSVEAESGALVTFDTAEQGIDRHLVKCEITGASAGSVRIRCKATYSDGSQVEGDGALVVAAA